MHLTKYTTFPITNNGKTPFPKTPKEGNLPNLTDSSNNNQAFTAIYERYKRQVFKKCLLFVKNRDEAKDLTQDIFLKIFIKAHTFNGHSKFSTWLYALVHNSCVNYVQRDLRKSHMDRLSSVGKYEFALLSSIPDDEENYDKEMLESSIVKLNKALDMIPEEDKALLIMKYQNNIPIEKLEHILNIKNSAVKMRLKRAKDKLVLALNNTEDNR
ncbi:RNA polymerase sigma factor [Mangrovibacterium sp.]|uniref:RNA polymerase sigma factor n=1 Tax=Mangrovibacterium sp. TaxID=1961364 RepID=UPI0035640405